MKELMVWSGGNWAAQSYLAVELAGFPGNGLLADYALGGAEISRTWGQGQCQTHQIKGSRAWIDVRKCIHCGTCETRCPFLAIHDLEVALSECQGCAQCPDWCAVEAITMQRDIQVSWEVCQKPSGVLIKAATNQNAAIATALIKQQALESAGKQKSDILISSGPSILDETLFTTLKGVSLVLLAVDLTNHKTAELVRVVSICTQFRIPTLVCLVSQGVQSSTEVEKFCAEKMLEIVGRISLAHASATEISDLWEKLQKRLFY